MKRKPERIRKVAMRLGVSFKIEKNELPAAPPQLSNGGRYAGAAWHRKFSVSSFITSKADIRQRERLVRFGPKREMLMATSRRGIRIRSTATRSAAW
jgi:hypothetical protein